MTAKQVPPTLTIVPETTTVPDPFEVAPPTASSSTPTASSSTAATPATSPSPTTPTPMVGGVLDVVPTDQFEALMRRGRARGGLTQDDVVTVLRTVELNEDLIREVVRRIRAAGIEFTYDTGETTVVPVVAATLGDATSPLTESSRHLPQHRTQPDHRRPVSSLSRTGGEPSVRGERPRRPGGDGCRPGPVPGRRERAPRRSAGQRWLCRQ